MQSSDLFHYCFQKQTCTCLNKSRHGRCSSVLSTHTTLGLFSFQSLLNVAAVSPRTDCSETQRIHTDAVPQGCPGAAPEPPASQRSPRPPAQPMTARQRGAGSIYILLQKKRASTYMRGKGANNNYLNPVPTILPTAPTAAAAAGLSPPGARLLTL